MSLLEIIADKLSNAGAASQQWIPMGERSWSLTPIATTESVSLCTQMTS
jgi:hypothetical protein